MVHSFDLFSTFVEIGGAAAPADQEVDGISLVPLLKQEVKTLKRDAFHWHFPTSMWSRHPGGAMRKGDYKLIEHYETNEVELYNLLEDIGETTNLAKTMPEKSAQLLSEFHAWREEVGARMPTLNPNYDPKRADESGNKQKASR
jgi:arylsulfatase A-like enzyme